MTRPFLATPLALAALLWASVALAGQPVELKTNLFAPGGTATLGDLFQGAGAAAKVKVAIVASTETAMVLDADQVQRRARMAGLDWSNPDGLRRLVVTVTPARTDATPAGVRQANVVEALTYARTLTAGQTVGAADVVWTKVEARLVPVDAAHDPSQVIGQMERRAVAEGSTVAAHDVVTAVVIRRDQIISVAFDTGGVRLVLQGRALGDAHLGEMVQVLNTASKKTIEAVASGPGEAVIGPEAESLKARSFASLR
jgi:flagella basal body P-ring formation protein FlgA